MRKRAIISAVAVAMIATAPRAGVAQLLNGPPADGWKAQNSGRSPTTWRTHPFDPNRKLHLPVDCPRPEACCREASAAVL